MENYPWWKFGRKDEMQKRSTDTLTILLVAAGVFTAIPALAEESRDRPTRPLKQG
jgi:hypothetical protein